MWKLRPVSRVVPAAGLVAVALAGCGAGGAAPRSSPAPAQPPPTPAARAELAARATAAQDLVAVSFYALRPPGGDDRTVMVVRAADGGWRVDIAGGALGGTADVSVARTADGLFQCGSPGCVKVDELTPEVDPRVQRVFTDWLDVLSDRSAPLSVSAAEPLDGSTGGDCFGVQPSAASLLAPLDAGVYCYEPDGTLTAADLELGSLRLTGDGDVAPPAVDLPAPVITGSPLPTASPTPSASPSPLVE